MCGFRFCFQHLAKFCGVCRLVSSYWLVRRTKKVSRRLDILLFNNLKFINIFRLFFLEFVSRFFSQKLLIPFSRVTYCAYLLNPIVILFTTMLAQTTFHLDFYTVAIHTIGTIVVTYIAGFAFMLLFENPIITITTKLTTKHRK